MLNLPERTLYNKRIPKNKFYEKLKANTKLKELFVEQVDSIIWKHKLSRETINLEPTEEVQEIQVFEICLKQKDLSREVLESIDKAIPYPILYVLLYEGEAQFVIAYKQRNQNDENKFIINGYYESEWQPINSISTEIIKGIDLQTVYENIIRSFMPLMQDSNEELSDMVEKQNMIEKLKKICRMLETKISSERQFNRKVELNLELQKIRKELSKFGL